jgi:hypothetical protein
VCQLGARSGTGLARNKSPLKRVSTTFNRWLHVRRGVGVSSPYRPLILCRYPIAAIGSGSLYFFD